MGESAHFRLYVSPGVQVPAGFEGESALTALETNWADTATLLPLTAGKIEYHWVVTSELPSACEPGADGCEREGPIVVAADLPFQHELNHAYMELITGTNATPISILTEGLAEAIGCGQKAGPSGISGTSGALLSDPTPWQDLITAFEISESFATEGLPEGALLVRYLIRTHGADAFVAYYEQAPEVRDPGLFADNFQRFWGMSIDAAWSAMKTVGPGEYTYDSPLCPCSLPSIPLDQQLAVNPVTTPYWTIPGATGSTVALQGAPNYFVHDFDCLGQRFDLTGGDEPGGLVGTSLVRLGTGVRGYVLAPLTSAATGNFVADTCADAELYTLPVGLYTGALDVQVDRSTAASDVVYLQLQPPPGATTLSFISSKPIDTCATCAFDTPACPAGHALAPQGTTYVRLPLTLSGGSLAEVTSTLLFFN